MHGSRACTMRGDGVDPCRYYATALAYRTAISSVIRGLLSLLGCTFGINYAWVWAKPSSETGGARHSFGRDWKHNFPPCKAISMSSYSTTSYGRTSPKTTLKEAVSTAESYCLSVETVR